MERKHIFLIGFMGAGKSTVAAELARQTQRTVIEMDARIEREEQKKISDIFADFGEAYFRSLETKLLETIGEEPAAIVSCGGGAAMREENRDIMHVEGYTVLLTAKPNTIYERVRFSTERPILNQNMSVEYIQELMEKRRPAYEAAADFIVWTDGKNVSQISQEILEQIEGNSGR
ncbi:MAG: shikimate kinase [bacterium]|nr:shikimate kinase [bacterium]